MSATYTPGPDKAASDFEGRAIGDAPPPAFSRGWLIECDACHRRGHIDCEEMTLALESAQVAGWVLILERERFASPCRKDAGLGDSKTSHLCPDCARAKK